MRNLIKVMAILVRILAALIVLGWLGLQVDPAPFPAFRQQPARRRTVPLPAGLPAPTPPGSPNTGLTEPCPRCWCLLMAVFPLPRVFPTLVLLTRKGTPPSPISTPYEATSVPPGS